MQNINYDFSLSSASADQSALNLENHFLTTAVTNIDFLWGKNKKFPTSYDY